MAYTIPGKPSLNIISADPVTQLATEAVFRSTVDSLASLIIGAVFGLGCSLLDDDTGNNYKNTGTVAIPIWSLDPASGSGITTLTGDVTAGPGSGSQAATIAALAVTTGKIADLAVTAGKIAADAVTTAKILNANVTLAKLAAGITPSHIVKYAGQPTTVGGAAEEAFTVTGALATDLAFVQLVDEGGNTVAVEKAVVTSNTLTVTFSADPGNDAIINYQLLRAAA